MSIQPLDGAISVQKLYETIHFDEILKANLTKLEEWKRTYPAHENWIRKVVRKFKDDAYNRIAFGGFFYERRSRKDVLCCSVIIKKNPYTPYLEIKNLIVFKHPGDGSIEDYRHLYQHQLISHIKKFAEQRGYPKLVTELSTKDPENRDLIKIYLDNGFIIAGRQSDRYSEKDETIFLTGEVNQVYGFDPYDNYNASLWILSRYLKASRLEESDCKIELMINQGKNFLHDGYVFYSGKKYDQKPESDFNSKNCLLIVEEYFKSVNDVFQINEIVRPSNGLAQFFVFDFSKELLSKNINSSDIKVFDSEALKNLMYGSNQNKLLRFDYKDIGGLLLISNPKRFPFSKADSLLARGENAIYIKLGALGRYVTQGMPIVLAYYPEGSERSKLQIWAIAEISEDAIPVNLVELRENKSKEESSKDPYTDGELLFNFLQENFGGDGLETDEQPSSILWGLDEFDKHNSYNATDRVICFKIKSYKNLCDDSNPARIDIEHVLNDASYTEDIENVFDFYLSAAEVRKLKEMTEEVPSIANPQEEPPPIAMPQNETVDLPMKILFLSANPTNLDKLQTEREHRLINDQISLGKNRTNFEFLPPRLDVTIDSLLRAMNEMPHIIHFSGHGNTKGISITGAQNESQLLSWAAMKRIFGSRQNSVKCIVMNSCYSAKQAKELSQFGMYIIANKSKLDDEAALSFSRGLYNGLGEGKSILESVHDGLTVVTVEYPKEAKWFELWKDGNEMPI